MMFKSRKIGEMKNPIFIVGMCPGKQRKQDANFEVFHGNRTGDLIEKVIQSKSNIFLTNVINQRVDGKITLEVVEEGRREFINDVAELDPCKIICLGKFAYHHATLWLSSVPKIEIVHVQHPSYVLRFNKDVENYINKLISLL